MRDGAYVREQGGGTFARHRPISPAPISPFCLHSPDLSPDPWSETVQQTSQFKILVTSLRQPLSLVPPASRACLLCCSAQRIAAPGASCGQWIGRVSEHVGRGVGGVSLVAVSWG